MPEPKPIKPPPKPSTELDAEAVRQLIRIADVLERIATTLERISYKQSI